MIPDKMQAARYQVAKKLAPYLSTILWSLIPVEVKDLQKIAMGPIGVDKWHRLYFDPEAIKPWSVEGLAVVLIHECQHIVRRHMHRFQPPCDPIIANLAEDIVINESLKAEGKTLPIEGVFATTVKLPTGKVEEWYYDELMKKAEQNVKKAGGVGQGNCGSCTGGNKREWEEGPPDGKNSEGIEETEGKLIVNQTLKEIAQGRGTIPGDLKQLAEEWLKPKIDWRRKLQKALRGSFSTLAGMVDYTYSKPSRRQAGSNVILPSLRRPRPNVAIIADTSGSMWSKEQFALVLGETEGILKACGMKDGVPFFSVDADVQAKGRIFSPKQVQLKGGGGTDMCVGINAATNLKPIPDTIIVLTDCMTPWPSAPLKKSRMIVVGINAPEESVKGVPKWANYVGICLE